MSDTRNRPATSAESTGMLLAAAVQGGQAALEFEKGVDPGLLEVVEDALGSLLQIL